MHQVEGGLFVGVGLAEGLEDFGETGDRAKGFELDLGRFFEHAWLANGGMRRLVAHERAGAGGAERAAGVMADATCAGVEEGLRDFFHRVLGDEGRELVGLGLGLDQAQRLAIFQAQDIGEQVVGAAGATPLRIAS